MQSIKEHNLKANHNKLGGYFYVKNLYAIYQRTQSESKSQLVTSIYAVTIICMQSIKEHNLKANHNAFQLKTYSTDSVCNLSKNTI